MFEVKPRLFNWINGFSTKYHDEILYKIERDSGKAVSYLMIGLLNYCLINLNSWQKNLNILWRLKNNYFSFYYNWGNDNVKN